MDRYSKFNDLLNIFMKDWIENNDDIYRKDLKILNTDIFQSWSLDSKK